MQTVLGLTVVPNKKQVGVQKSKMEQLVSIKQKQVDGITMELPIKKVAGVKNPRKLT